MSHSPAISSVYPVLMTDDVTAAADFFVDHFGFRATFTSDWYVSLASAGGELALLDPTHPTVPAGFGTPAAGVLVNVEVDDVDALYRQLVVESGAQPVLELRDEDFGQRHFIVRGPGHSLVDVITEIPPRGEFVDAFETQGLGGTS